jgi:hypothetical protein
VVFDDNQIDALDSLNVFLALAGEKFAPYATERVIEGNLEIIYRFGKDHFPGGLAAFKEVGAYEIAFAQTIGTLTRDSNWISRADRNAALKKTWDSLSASDAKQRYADDPEIRRYVDGGNQ